MFEETRSDQGCGDTVTEETPDAYREAWDEYTQETTGRE